MRSPHRGLKMVECIFRDITTVRLRRGVFRCVPDLIVAINYVTVHNQEPQTIHANCPSQRHPTESRLRQPSPWSQGTRNIAHGPTLRSGGRKACLTDFGSPIGEGAPAEGTSAG